MTLGEIRAAVKNRLPLKAGLTGLDARINDWINEVVQDISDRHQWSWLRSFWTVRTYAKYETGTASVTNGSAAVVGSGTAWTAAMAERVFWLGKRYIIQSVTDSTHLTLASPYDGSTATGQTYAIVDDRVLLPSDCRRLTAMREGTGRRRVYSTSQEIFSRVVPYPQAFVATAPSYKILWSRHVTAVPTTAPAVAAAGAGSLSGTFQYRVSFVGPRGSEGNAGPASTSLTVAAAAQINLTAIPTLAGHNRRLWRTRGTSTEGYFLLADIADDTTTTYADTTSDASLTSRGRYTDNNGQQEAILYPIPTTAFNLEMFGHRYAPRLVLDEDVPLVPPTRHYVIIEGVMARAVPAIEGRPGETHLVLYENGIKAMQAEDEPDDDFVLTLQDQGITRAVEYPRFDWEL